ncbi:MAG TPA: membrane protein insertase YidC [Isosphaeraceae bacterium]|jgi:YidC/Oxa1 family membrane protein insertase|nr:membrane protein insertase YidC [Isosphaeraceae bacterium]
MSTEKRFILFIVLTFFIFYGAPILLDKLGLAPAPAPVVEEPAEKDGKAKDAKAPVKGPEKVADAGKDQAKAGDANAKGKAKAEEAPKPKATALKPPAVPIVPEDELVLGSTAKDSGYKLRVDLSQRGAGVRSIASALFEAERVEGLPRHRPLQILQEDLDRRTLPSFAMALAYDYEGILQVSSKAGADRRPLLELRDPDGKVTAYVNPPAGFDPAPFEGHEVGVRGDFHRNDELEADLIDARSIDPIGETGLDRRPWTVERDAKGRVVQPAVVVGPGGERREGQKVVFSTKLADPPVTIRKTFTLTKGADGLRLELAFKDDAEAPQTIVYKLWGPHGIPIEGEWYTQTFRDVFVGQGGGGKLVTDSAAGVAGATEPPRFTNYPLRFAGVEDQYFASFLKPEPASADERWDAETTMRVVHEDPDEKQKSDVTVVVTSKPIQVGPNRPVAQVYSIFAGPKTPEALAPFGAEEVASYRKGWAIFQSIGTAYLAQNVISPLLRKIHDLTAVVARPFGKPGNYGVAIILLTICVRLVLFPLGRKAAMTAKKMQAIQPQLNEIRAKHKDDPAKAFQETQAVQREAGVKPLAGCLPAMIQLPIFMGLWQALNTSVVLRHEGFLWIKDLAAPDQLFRFPFPIPLIGGYIGPYFNLLPLIVAGLMLVQTKLFSPPPTTPEAEMQQKMMKFMMIFMAFMFYKVPAGLGIYFITSSLWAICERLLLPKVIHTPPSPAADDRPGGGGPGLPKKPGGNGSSGWLSRKFEQLLEEAAKQQTIRNESDARSAKPQPRDNDRNRPRSKPGKRR